MGVRGWGRAVHWSCSLCTVECGVCEVCSVKPPCSTRALRPQWVVRPQGSSGQCAVGSGHIAVLPTTAYCLRAHTCVRALLPRRQTEHEPHRLQCSGVGPQLCRVRALYTVKRPGQHTVHCCGRLVELSELKSLVTVHWPWPLVSTHLPPCRQDPL